MKRIKRDFLHRRNVCDVSIQWSRRDKIPLLKQWKKTMMMIIIILFPFVLKKKILWFDSWSGMTVTFCFDSYLIWMMKSAICVFDMSTFIWEYFIDRFILRTWGKAETNLDDNESVYIIVVIVFWLLSRINLYNAPGLMSIEQVVTRFLIEHKYVCLFSFQKIKFELIERF